MSPSGCDDTRLPTGPGRWQFGLASLLVFITICAVAFSFYRPLGPEIVTFIIGFSALILFLLRMISHTPPGSLVVINVDSDAAAHTLRSHLRGCGIAAEVVTEGAAQAFQLAYTSPQIAVPVEQAERARGLIAELAGEVKQDDLGAG